MTFAQTLKQASVVALHMHGSETHSLEISKAQVKRLAGDRKLNEFGEAVDEWNYDEDIETLHIHV